MLSPPPETRASLILRLPDPADAEAWEEFVRLYGPVVYRLARSRGAQPTDADDLVQEVLAVIAARIEDWLERRDRGPFRAWLATVARNTTLNFLTRGPAARERSGMLHDSESELHSVESFDAEVTQRLDREYRRRLFELACEQVRPRVRPVTWEAFWLTAIRDRKAADVARELNLSVGNVYIARSRVMSRLREWVQQYEAQDERPADGSDRSDR